MASASRTAERPTVRWREDSEDGVDQTRTCATSPVKSPVTEPSWFVVAAARAGGAPLLSGVAAGSAAGGRVPASRVGDGVRKKQGKPKGVNGVDSSQKAVAATCGHTRAGERRRGGANEKRVRRVTQALANPSAEAQGYFASSEAPPHSTRETEKNYSEIYRRRSMHTCCVRDVGVSRGIGDGNLALPAAYQYRAGLLLPLLLGRLRHRRSSPPGAWQGGLVDGGAIHVEYHLRVRVFSTAVRSKSQ